MLVARNCHKSVYNAIELNFLRPIYIQPQVDKFGIERQIEPEEIKSKLEENKDIKLIILTSPTYEGIISNVREITKIAHKYSIPVLVDEAHGAHLNFCDNLKQYEALNSGADIVIQSLHKTLPALTQCAIMHIGGEIVKGNEVARQLSIFETSSPSYILMASIQECLNILENQGKEMFTTYKQNLETFYEQANSLKKIKVLGNNIKVPYDNGKIVIITKNTNITGKQLSEILRNKYKIEVEMSSINYVIAMTSICDKEENFKRLENVLQEIDRKLATVKTEETDYMVTIPEMAMGINEAINFENSETLNIKNSLGKISKEYIWVYPPGIPLVTPGEVINENIINKLLNIEGANIDVRTSYRNYPNIEIINEKIL